MVYLYEAVAFCKNVFEFILLCDKLFLYNLHGVNFVSLTLFHQEDFPKTAFSDHTEQLIVINGVLNIGLSHLGHDLL